MRQKPGRLFKVSAADFPIEVTIEAKNLPACQAFVSNTVIVVDDEPIESVRINVRTDGMTKKYRIALPAHSPCDAISVINGYFSKTAPNTAKYAITLAAASGDSGRTTMYFPVLNPSAATLVFRFR